ncbi:MAG: hypothetical protein ABL879_16165 [Devosia sp.]
MDALPNTIKVGMKVYDAHHHAIGKIKDFKLAENATDPDLPPADYDKSTDATVNPVAETVSNIFGRESLPDAVRSRMLTEGYIEIDTAGLFTGDRYALPEHIASANGDEVMLNVDKDELIKRPN